MPISSVNKRSRFHEAAIRLHEAGLCVLPAKRRDKRPLVSWNQYQATPPDRDELDSMFSERSADAICVVCGATSGSIEAIDFDCGGAAFEPWRELVEAAAPGLIERPVVQSTPSGGRHVIYRCDEPVSGSLKLAWRMATPSDSSDGKAFSRTVLIETRGEGGLVLCAPTDGYTLVQGALSNCPTITAAERAVLHRCAVALDESAPPIEDTPSSPRQRAGDGLRPGDDYNRRGDLDDLLLRHGWTKIGAPRGGNQAWRRPGKHVGISATTKVIDGTTLFYNFSSNAAPFDADRGYSPFQVFARLEHGGDYSAAASALAKDGFGESQPCAAPSAEGVSRPKRFRTLDGIGNGERFVDQHGKDIRYSYELKTWLMWTGTQWSLDSEAHVHAMAKQTARSIVDEMHEAIKAARQEGGSDSRIESMKTLYRKHAKSAARVAGVRDMLTMAQSEPGVKVAVSDLDAEPMLLNVANGTIDLSTGKLLPHSRDHLITKAAPIEFNPDAKCPLWLSVLDRIFDNDIDLISYIQRAAGYSLTGQVGEQNLFFLHGGGQNGKSVFVQTMLSALGPYSQKAPTELIMKRDRSSGGASPDLARLRGVRMAVAAEVNENQRMDEARVKDLTGADRIVARHLYRDPIEFDPTHKLWIYGNHKPMIVGDDYGIWRRIHLIPFTVTISEEEKDPHLLEKLTQELPGILTWAVQGCLDWQRHGLAPPNVVVRATAQYRSESDRIGAFIDECCTVLPSATVTKAQLYEAYKRYCESSGERPISKKALHSKLEGRGFEEFRRNSGRAWVGLGLLDREGMHESR